MKLGFATDIHLDWIKDTKNFDKHRRIGAKLAKGLDALVIGGDISTGPKLKDHLEAFCEGAGIPVYFVLGNHDFWDADEEAVLRTASSLNGFLDAISPVALRANVALIGRTGWYDTHSGNPFDSKWLMTDWRRTERLKGAWATPYLLVQTCKKWAEESLSAIHVLERAAREYSEIYFVTHFPLFTEAYFNENDELDTEENGMWPWSINTVLGNAVRYLAENHPATKFTVLTGHTHGSGRAQILDNLLCISGKAKYGSPAVAEVFTI